MTLKRNFSLSPLEQPIKNSFSSAPRWKQIKECRLKLKVCKPCCFSFAVLIKAAGRSFWLHYPVFSFSVSPLSPCVLCHPSETLILSQIKKWVLFRHKLSKILVLIVVHWQRTIVKSQSNLFYLKTFFLNDKIYVYF